MDESAIDFLKVGGLKLTLDRCLSAITRDPTVTILGSAMPTSASDLLTQISDLADRWFNNTVTTQSLRPAPARNANRRRPQSQNVADVFQRGLGQRVVQDVSEILDLERCGLLLPLNDKQRLWHLFAHHGYPDRIRERKTYRPGLGLSGLALQGHFVHTADLLSDERRSRAHGDKWVGRDDSIVEGKPRRALFAIPIWQQPADLYRTTLGALIGIREEPFDKAELSAMPIIAQSVAQGFQGLRVYQDKLHSAVRNADLVRTWKSEESEDAKLHHSLRLIQQLVPFKRLLLSLVSECGTMIVGRAAVGFRRGLIGETRRHIFPDAPAPDSGETEDILALFVREARLLPEFVSHDDPHVHRITALRYQVHNDLLLIPLVSTSGEYVGLILTELPDADTPSSNPRLLSPADLQRCALFAQQLADLIAINREMSRLLHKHSTHQHLLSALLAGARGDPDRSALGSVLEYVCTSFGITRAAVFDYDECDALVRCAASTGLDVYSASQFCLSVPDKTDSPSLLERALATSIPISGALSDGFCSLLHTDCKAVASTCSVGIALRYQGDSLGVLVVEAACESDARASLLTGVYDFIGAFVYALRIRRLERRVQRVSEAADAQESFIHLVGSVVADRDQRFENLHEIVRHHHDTFATMLQDVARVLDAQLSELFIPELPVRLDEDGQIPPASIETQFHNIVRFCSLPAPFQSRSVTGAASGDRQSYSEAKETIRGGLTASVLQTMHRQCSSNVPSDQVWSGARLEFEESKPRTWVGIPIVYDFDGETYCWGVLTATRLRESPYDRRVFTENEQARAQALAEWIAVALARRYELRAGATRTEAFLSRFDHDLRSIPLSMHNTVSAFVEESDPGERERLADSMYASLHAFEACYTSLLASYGGRKRSPSSDSEVDFGRVRAQLSQLVGLQSMSGGVQVDVFNDTPYEFACKADEQHLVYVLYMLVHNALRACADMREADVAFRGRVTVRATLSESAGRAIISVEDNGHGFPSAIVGPRRTAEGRSFWNSGRPGSGLGLVLVRRLVPLMGGENLELRNGEPGATVRFMLHTVSH